MSTIQKLSSDLESVDQQLAAAPSDDLSKRHVALQTELDLITTNEAERLLFHSRSKYYEHGDKSGRLLAHQLRCQAASSLIPALKIVREYFRRNWMLLTLSFHLFMSPCTSMNFR